MVRKIVNLFLIAFVTSLLVVKSSSNLIENEILEELKAELKSLRVKVDLLETKNADNEAKIGLQELKMGLQEAKNAEQEEEIVKLKAKIDAKLEADHLPGSFQSTENIEIASINKNSAMGGSLGRALKPESCRDLESLGHSYDGFYLVRNPTARKIEVIYCDFGIPVVQEPIGTVDVKTKSVHFYVQRNSNFGTPSAVIPFELARINEGNGFDLASGIFTVPVPGIYHFDFSAVIDSSATYLRIDLQVNGANVGLSYTSHGATGSFDVVSLSASLRLAVGDKVNLFNYGNGVLLDRSNDHFTHFSGWLVDEDFM